MTSRKILEDKKINWFDNRTSRLNYEMIFCNNESDGDQREKEIDIDLLLKERDRQWLEKLKKAREESYTAGFEEGKKEGLDEAHSEIDSRTSALKQAFEEAQEEWLILQKTLEPGLLNLVFAIAEKILGIPVENPKITEKLESELGSLLQKLDEQSRPVLRIPKTDHKYIEKLYQEYAPVTPVRIIIREECNPGEFELETNRETVIQNYRKMLDDFKNTLSLPPWN
jgi:flagellar biosynthesis/type III secretory pathway protein FliH